MASVIRGSGTSSLGGNLDIEGVLTYEDVTSVDSVGVITARSGIDVGTGTSIFSPSSNVLTLGTNSSERLRITSTGNVAIGHTITHGSGKLQSFTNNSDGIDILAYSSTAANGGRLTFYRSKNGTIGDNTEVADNDSLGRIDWRGYNDDGTAFNIGATIEAEVDGLVNSTTDMPSALVFKTSADGSSTPTERLRLTSDGNIGINSTNPTSYSNSQATLVIEDTISPALCISDTGQARDWFLIGQGDGLALNYADGGGSSSASNVTGAAFFRNNGNVGIGEDTPAYKLQVNGSFFVDNDVAYFDKHIIRGSGSWTATSNVLHVSKTFTNGAYFNAFRFNRVNADSNNNKIGVLGGKLHIVYINDRTNAVQTSGYDVFPFVVRGRSADTMSGTIGSVETDIHNVIGSSVQVRFVSASTTTIDMQIYIYNSDGGGAEQFCHAWIETGEIGTDTNRMIFPTLL